MTTPVVLVVSAWQHKHWFIFIEWDMLNTCDTMQLHDYITVAYVLEAINI